MDLAFTAPTPDLVQAFDLVLEHGSVAIVGAIATGGVRSHHPITGGSFSGEGLSGTVTGGSETWLDRADGVTMVEANYYITFADGAVARCFGQGYRTAGASTRLALLFEAAEDGSVAGLATRAFLGERVEGSTRLVISRIV